MPPNGAEQLSLSRLIEVTVDDFDHSLKGWQFTLLALHSAQAAQPAGRERTDAAVVLEREAYRAGFQAALQSVALAFGIALDVPRAQAQKPSERRQFRLREPAVVYDVVSGAAEAQYE